MATSEKDKKAYQFWCRRLKASRKLRSDEQNRHWKPLYDGIVGQLGRSGAEGEPEHINAIAEFVEVLMPNLLGRRREVLVRPQRVRPGVDPAAAQDFAEMLADQATAIMHATGFYAHNQGVPGERAKIVCNSLWGLGVALVGFEPGRGLAEDGGGAPDDQQQKQVVDLDFAAADHSEFQDPGMPFIRSIDPRRFLGDPTFNDFSKGSWFGVEYFVTEAEARALWPEYKEQWKGRVQSVPVWSGEEEDEKGDAEQPGKLVAMVDVYTRRPGLVLSIPAENQGVDCIVSRREIDLGIEGLPILLLGYNWLEGRPYPVPPTARLFFSANEENDLLRTAYAAAHKVKSAIIVPNSDEKLAARLRQGDPNGVYETDIADPKNQIHTIEVGGLRREHLDMAERARQNTERSSGLSDMVLGRREPGEKRVAEIQQRDSAISNRVNQKSDRVDEFEAAAARSLMSVVYAKIHLLHGLQLPVGEGDDARFAVMDATQPVAGELVDYLFEVSGAEKLSPADRMNQANNLLQMLPNYQQLLQMEGKLLLLGPLVETVLQASGLPRAGEVLQDAPPPEPPAEEQPMDPAAELEALQAQLQQVPEGDPAEEQILQRMAELTAMLEQQAPPVAA